MNGREFCGGGFIRRVGAERLSFFAIGNVTLGAGAGTVKITCDVWGHGGYMKRLGMQWLHLIVENEWLRMLRLDMSGFVSFGQGFQD